MKFSYPNLYVMPKLPETFSVVLDFLLIGYWKRDMLSGVYSNHSNILMVVIMKSWIVIMSPSLSWEPIFWYLVIVFFSSFFYRGTGFPIVHLYLFFCAWNFLLLHILCCACLFSLSSPCSWNIFLSLILKSWLYCHRM